jgi:predicted methyltransferase
VTRRLTGLAHTAVRDVVRPGDIAVDGTAGNGHDTLFLAEVVSPTGRVFAFDTQSAAIQATRRRLHTHGRERTVELIAMCHSRLGEILPPQLEINAAMFNLGYLPGGDKHVTTLSKTTLAALSACLERLAVGGILTLVAYRGHPGGATEAADVDARIESLPPEQYVFERHESPAAGPVLWVIRRRI